MYFYNAADTARIFDESPKGSTFASSEADQRGAFPVTAPACCTRRHCAGWPIRLRSSVRSFVFAMMIGVVVGTITSLFVATPVANAIMSRQNAKKELEATKK